MKKIKVTIIELKILNLRELKRFSFLFIKTGCEVALKLNASQSAQR